MAKSDGVWKRALHAHILNAEPTHGSFVRPDRTSITSRILLAFMIGLCFSMLWFYLDK